MPPRAQAPQANQANSAAGVWTAGVIWLLITVYGWLSGGFHQLFPAIGAIFTGDLDGVRALPDTFGQLFPVGAAAVAVSTVAGIPLLIIVNKLFGSPKGHTHADNIRVPGWMRKPSYQFMFYIGVILAEEVGARWLMLGLLPKLPGLGGKVAFYVLFLLGNGIWSLIHLRLYKDPKNRRQPLRVLPQFVAGIIYTIVYVNFGLLGVFLVHMADDMILFAVDRIGKFNAGEKLIIVYNTVLAGASGLAVYLLHTRPADMLNWFHQNRVYDLPGWSFWDYFWTILLLSSLLTIVGELLLLDRVAPKDEPFKLSHIILGMMIMVGLLMGLNWVLEHFTHDLAPRIVIMAILLLLVNRAASGSGVARTFWIGVPTTALLLCAISAMGFWSSVILLTIMALLDLPENAIRIEDAESERPTIQVRRS